MVVIMVNKKEIVRNLIEMKIPEGFPYTKVACKCGYEWYSKSTKEYVTCPSCMKKVNVNRKVDKNAKK